MNAKSVSACCGLCVLAVLEGWGQQKNLSSTGTVAVAQQAAPAARDVRVLPGSILTVWKEEDVSQPELAMLVDSAKTFDNLNGKVDPAVQSVTQATSRWSGILNIEEPGLYTFNAIYMGWRNAGRAHVCINGVKIMELQGGGTMSKNVQIPGPVNLEVVISAPCSTALCDRQTGVVKLRYKKAGKLEYREVTPERMFHQAE